MATPVLKGDNIMTAPAEAVVIPITTANKAGMRAVLADRSTQVARFVGGLPARGFSLLRWVMRKLRIEPYYDMGLNLLKRATNTVRRYGGWALDVLSKPVAAGLLITTTPGRAALNRTWKFTSGITGWAYSQFRSGLAWFFGLFGARGEAIESWIGKKLDYTQIKVEQFIAWAGRPLARATHPHSLTGSVAQAVFVGAAVSRLGWHFLPGMGILNYLFGAAALVLFGLPSVLDYRAIQRTKDEDPKIWGRATIMADAFARVAHNRPAYEREILAYYTAAKDKLSDTDLESITEEMAMELALAAHEAYREGAPMADLAERIHDRGAEVAHEVRTEATHQSEEEARVAATVAEAMATTTQGGETKPQQPASSGSGKRRH